MRFFTLFKSIEIIIEEILVREIQELKLNTGFKGVDCGWYRDAQLLYCVQLNKDENVH